MGKRVLNDRALKALKPALAGQRYDVMDAVVPGLGVRVTDKGHRSFILVCRPGGSKNPTRRRLGVHGALTLERARAKARDWIELIGKGIDPAHEEERQRRAEQRKRDQAFAIVAEQFIAAKLSKERKGAEVERELRRDFIPAFGGKPITEVTDEDVLLVINQKKETAPAQARNLLVTAKRFFNWAIAQRKYGVTASPCERLMPKDIFGDKIPRQRSLSADELFALWRAAGRTPYPSGPFYRLLVLSGLRLNELARISWSEFHPELRRLLRQRDETGQPVDWSRVGLEHRTLTIPATRMKAKEHKARPHAVPLPQMALEILETIPRFEQHNDKGRYVFSVTQGRTPAWISDKVKARMDKRMLRTLRALDRQRGEQPRAELKPWVNHDLRRNVRSGLSALRVEERVREAVLAHVPAGITGTYDVHDWLPEKAEALELWAGRLRSIVEPVSANVVAFSKATA